MGTGKRDMSGEGSCVTVKEQVNLIRLVASAEIVVGIIVLLGQTVAIAFSYEFATRSLTGIWTSWFFLMSAGIALFWSTRCTFNGLLAVLVLQIISGTMGVPLFTSSCLLFGVYPFKWSASPNGDGRPLVTSSTVILTANLIMMFCSIAQLLLNAYNAYNCYLLAYGETKAEIYEIDTHVNGQNRQTSTKQNGTVNSAAPPADEDEGWGDPQTTTSAQSNSSTHHVVQFDDPATPQPQISSADLIVLKYCGVTGVFMAVLIFCCQTSMLAMASEIGINIGIGIWGAIYYGVTGVITVYNALKPTNQSSVAIFTLQTLQFVISVPLVGIAYYILAVFGSCMQEVPEPECPPGNMAAGITLTCLSGVMALSGTVQGLTSLTLMLICSQTVCDTRCMISGASVYPTL